MAKVSLEKTMAEMRKSQVDLAMVQAKKERSLDDMDYSQVGLPGLYVKNEMNQPPQEEISNLEATITELRRVQAELATS